ncbi:TraB/GumN family protein [soil metagenome]
MRKTMNKLLVTLIIPVLFPFVVKSQTDSLQKSKPGIFYAITGNELKDTSFLFGTYHLIKSEYLSKTPNVSRSFSKTKGVVVEMVTDSDGLVDLQIKSLLKNITLYELLEKPFLDSLDKELMDVMGVGVSSLFRMKPANISALLSINYAMSTGGPEITKYGGMEMDGFFADEGAKKEKTITPLETMKEQIDLLFLKQSDKEQAEELKMLLRNKQEMLKQSELLTKSWFGNDLEGIYQTYLANTELAGNDDALLKDRNIKWMTVLPALMKKQGQFIAVGALHLAGPDGLVKRLEAAGYKVVSINL